MSEVNGSDDNRSFGEWLRRERERRGITLEEIAEATKIGKRYLEAFERERVDVIPRAPIFARGFLRQYAEYVGLDPEEVLNRFDNAISFPSSYEVRKEEKWNSVPLRFWLVVGFVFFIIVLFIIVSSLSAGNVGSDSYFSYLKNFYIFTGENDRLFLGISEEFFKNDGVVVTVDALYPTEIIAFIDGKFFYSYPVLGDSIKLVARESLELQIRDPSVARLLVNGRVFELVRVVENIPFKIICKKEGDLRIIHIKGGYLR